MSDRPEGGSLAPRPAWGLRHIVAGWLAALFLSQVTAGIVLSATGHLEDPEQAPYWTLALIQAALSVGLAGAPVVAARAAHQRLSEAFGLVVRWIDVLVGLAVGVAAQLVLVPLVSWPWLQALGKDFDDLEEKARELADRATDPVGVTLFVLAVVVLAPVVEELFFRGLVQRTALRVMPPAAAIAVSATVFGLTHFQVLQLPALVAFGAVLGVLAHRSGRLGPAILAHAAFNAVTVFSLLVLDA